MAERTPWHELKDIKYEADAARADASKLSRLLLADGRLIIGPEPRIISVDLRKHKLFPTAFDLTYTLAMQADEPISTEELARKRFGWDNLRPDDAAKLNKSIRDSVNSVRELLGEELGDPKYGAIRTVHQSRMQPAGYVAVTEL